MAHVTPAATAFRAQLDALSSDGEAEVTEALLLLEDVVHHQSGAGAAAELRGAQLLVALQGHHKFPEGARTERLEEAVRGLKSESPDAEKRALQMQDEVVTALAPGVDMPALAAALEKVAVAANPKAADVKALLEMLPH